MNDRYSRHFLSVDRWLAISFWNLNISLSFYYSNQTHFILGNRHYHHITLAVRSCNGTNSEDDDYRTKFLGTICISVYFHKIDSNKEIHGSECLDNKCVSGGVKLFLCLLSIGVFTFPSAITVFQDILVAESSSKCSDKAKLNYLLVSKIA